MGMASHLGPWLLGTVKNTTGTNPALGQVRNMGATVCVQTATFSVPSGTTASGFTTTNLFTIPAGSVIHAIILDSVAAISATGTNTVTFQTGNATTGLTGNSGGNYPAATAIASVSGTNSIAQGRATATPSTTNLFTIPAGSVIHAIILDTVTAITATGTNTITFQTGNATTGLSSNFASGSAIATVTGSGSIAQGRATATPSTTNLALLNNIGTSDITVQVAVTLGATSSTGGTQNVQIVYGVRNPDGTYAPTSSQA